MNGGAPNPETGRGPERRRKSSSFLKEFSRFALRHNLLAVAHWIARAYFATIRIESVNEAAVRERLARGEKVLAAVWHQRIIAVIGYAAGFGEYRPSVMISGSRDGDLISDVFRRLNFRPVRGSSSRDGRKALSAMVEDLKRNPFAVHVLDGPKGPPGVIKPGLIVLARQSGVPVTPVYISLSRAWVLGSWDRMLVPKPFSRVLIHWDEPIPVPGEADADRFEEARRAIEKKMLEGQRREDSRFGWDRLI
jgi:lysophospholipid acyltransferase (LPLAT)-like uncharacterized protein